MTTIRGKRTRGLGIATQTVAAQLPQLIQSFPELKDCFRGTINVELEHPLLVERPDHQTDDFTWFLNGTPCTEHFGFLRIEFEAPLGGPRVPAWIYIASGSPHRETPRIHEVLAPRLEIPAHCECAIHIDRHPILAADGTVTIR